MDVVVILFFCCCDEREFGVCLYKFLKFKATKLKYERTTATQSLVIAPHKAE